MSTAPKQNLRSIRSASDLAFEAGLPASLDHERGILGACMVDAAACELAMSLCRDSDFSIEKHRRIWAAIQRIHGSGSPVDRVTVVQALVDRRQLESVDGMGYIASLDAPPRIPGLLESYCRILRAFAIRRMAILEAQKLQALAFESSESDDILAALQRATEALSASKAHSAAATLLSAEDVLDRDFGGDFNRFVGEGEAAQACPMPWTEALGGLRVGEMTILAARPGVGKSSAAAQIAMHSALAGCGVDLWSLEMRCGMILRRLIAGAADVSHYQMARGYLNPDGKQKAWRSLAQVAKLPLWIGDDAGATVETIRRRLRDAAARSLGVRLVIVDYLQLLSGGHGNNRNEEIGRVSRALKRLTLDFPVAVLALSQLSRDSEKEGNREPRLSDLRDSGSLEQDADNVVFIHRPSTADEGGSVLDVLWCVKKQRNGHTGATPLVFLRDKMRFEAVTK